MKDDTLETKLFHPEGRAHGNSFEEFGEFDTVSPINEGNVTSVLQVRRKSDDQLYAVKVLDSGRIISESPDSVSDKAVRAFHRSFNEMAFQTTLTHSGGRANHIVDCYGYGYSGDDFFAVFDFLQGKNLRNVLERDHDDQLSRQLYICAALDICDMLSDALVFIHSHGVMHRDVKPSNIMVSGVSGNGIIYPNQSLLDDSILVKDVRLTDLGTMLIANGWLSELSRACSLDEPLFDLPKLRGKDFEIAGAPAYRPPETAFYEPIRRVDEYSLGTTIYEVAFGKRPFPQLDLPELAKAKQGTFPTFPDHAGPNLGGLIRSLMNPINLKRIDIDRTGHLRDYAKIENYIDIAESAQAIGNSNLASDALEHARALYSARSSSGRYGLFHPLRQLGLRLEGFENPSIGRPVYSLLAQHDLLSHHML